MATCLLGTLDRFDFGLSAADPSASVDCSVERPASGATDSTGTSKGHQNPTIAPSNNIYIPGGSNLAFFPSLLLKLAAFFSSFSNFF